MTENPGVSDWAATRGAKWRGQLAGMEAMIAPIDDPLIRALRLDAPFRIADIGCGGGGTTLEILRRAPPGSVVHGFDISPASIEWARSRGPHDARVAFEIVDIATAAAPEEPYERLAARFSVMFFDDPPAAFANLVRWLAPRGRFAFAVWGPLLENPWMMCVREVVGEIVDMPPLDLNAAGPFRYAEVDKLIALLDHAGFRELAVSDWRGALPIGGGLPAAEAAKFALASFSSFSELLAQAGDQAFKDAQQTLTERYSRHQQEGTVRMDARVHIVAGTCLQGIAHES